MPKDELGLDDILTFGKYGGNGAQGPMTIRMIICVDPSYISYMIRSNPDFKLDEQANEFYTSNWKA